MTQEMPKFFEYMKFIGNLKRVPRTGWVRHDVKQPESVADHMYRMAMMSFALPPESTLDRYKCMKIALVHDVAESIVGDITPNCGISKTEKSQMEEKAAKHITSFLPSLGAQEVFQLWQEYEHQSSPEAKFVKDVDKFEMLFQAFEYEKLEDRRGELEEFFVYTNKSHKFSTDTVKKWADDLISIRDSMKDSDWNTGLQEAIKAMTPEKSGAPSAAAVASAVSSSTSTSEKLSAASLQSGGNCVESSSSAKKLKVDAGGDSSL